MMELWRQLLLFCQQSCNYAIMKMWLKMIREIYCLKGPVFYTPLTILPYSIYTRNSLIIFCLFFIWSGLLNFFGMYMCNNECSESLYVLVSFSHCLQVLILLLLFVSHFLILQYFVSDEWVTVWVTRITFCLLCNNFPTTSHLGTRP